MAEEVLSGANWLLPGTERMQRAEATGKADGQQINGDNRSLKRRYEEMELACRRLRKGIPHRKGRVNAESRALSRS